MFWWSPNWDTARGTLECVNQRLGIIGVEFMSHRRATSGPGSQYSIAQSRIFVRVHGLFICSPVGCGLAEPSSVSGGGNRGLMASTMYAKSPVGESHSAYASVWGRSRGCCCIVPGERGGVIPGTSSCIGDPWRGVVGILGA